jgi:hypothetical protein
MKNKLSFLGVSISIIGNIFLVTDMVLYGCILFLFSNVMLGYVNKHDKNQIVLYAVFQIIAIYGILRILSS